MPDSVIDLRSDTITRPTPRMREAIVHAELGDDVFGEDPNVNRLQEQVASLCGKEAALFVPSGTMSNQIAIRAHCVPGDELICEARCHIANYEAGGAAALSGVSSQILEGDFGILDVSQLDGSIKPDNEHFVRTRLVCLENTHNGGGGRIYPLEKIQAISEWARSHDLRIHLDGARLWNAIVATGIPASTWGEHFDTISLCFSKGLGAPLGSVLVGSRDLIAQARRIRKLYGGGMRQAGIAASAALYALENHVERLAEDHQNAQIIAQSIAEVPGLTLNPGEVETNLIWFEVDPEMGTAFDFVAAMKQRNVLFHPMSKTTVRACTHLDVSASQARRVAELIREPIRVNH